MHGRVRTNSPSTNESMQIAHSVALPVIPCSVGWNGATTVWRSSLECIHMGERGGDAEEERLPEDSEES